MANLEITYRGHLQLIIFEAMIQGKIECGTATQSEELLMRILTPLGKLYTGKEALQFASECIECLGGLGYMEDATLLPSMLREQQVNVIWEGTTNILSLDLFRALNKDNKALTEYFDYVQKSLDIYKQNTIRAGLDEVKAFIGKIGTVDMKVVEASARELCYLMAATFIGALLIRQYDWSKDETDKNIIDTWADKHIRKLVPLNIGNGDHLKFMNSIVYDGARGDVCRTTGKPRSKY